MIRFNGALVALKKLLPLEVPSAYEVANSRILEANSNDNDNGNNDDNGCVLLIFTSASDDNAAIKFLFY